eukprot:Clim_evm9s145 gene=Clim_evmTU9s145
MESDTPEATRKLWRVRKTVLQLCYDRGYLVSQAEMDMSLDEFVVKYGETPTRSDLLLYLAHKNDPSDTMMVFFPEEEKLGVKTAESYRTRMEERQCRRALVIVREGLTSQAAQELKKGSEDGYIIESFKEDELRVNITEHELVPKHIILSDEEKKALFERYKVSEAQLPRILSIDPVARYYGLKRGQIVKIIRTSVTAGRYVTYRLVI